MILKFEKAINKNQEMRVRYADQPEKFMESEADLDEEIKNLLSLTEAPQMYSEFVNLGSVSSLLSLLSHENTDIAIDTIDLINELTDEDVGMGSSEDDLERSEQVQAAIKTFVDAMLENELLQLLVQNLARLDEKEETDRQGVFKILGVLENVISLEPKYAQDIALKTDILPWLLKRLQTKGFDANIAYTSEILSILLQGDRDIRLKVGELDGIDVLLRALAGYRRKDASSEDESEMVENFFNAMCSLLNEPENKKRFLDAEGIELMVFMLKEKTLARIRAVKALFPLFMGKGNKKLKKTHHSAFIESEDEEHISCIILSLLRNLTQGDVQRMRLILKFTEDDHEKVDRLIELKEQYQKKDEAVKQELEDARGVLDEEDFEDFESDFYVRRLSAGLFTLQRVCLLIAALSEESLGIREKATMLLKRQGEDMLSVFKVIEEETALMADFIFLRRIARGYPTEEPPVEIKQEQK
ncbi:Catenin-beta-like protein [Thamnidium elegans]|nr:Catenin-beta-like protein [Thamnidium elegans]